ncbi:MAG: heavy-metal-associated domain-containing protein, partial [Cyclobacteriaceae bacterium]|nr:heavy-metal-associated domain-containing protein [Cyclobacteriaceae bacterium]
AEITFKIPNMVCEGCAETITSALKGLPGIQEVKPKVLQKQVYVRYESGKLQQQEVKDAIGNAGFTAVEV